MFDKEIQFITDFNLNKITTLGKSFSLNELLNTELHPAIIKYISGRLDYMIYEERKILLENSRFDYSGSKIAEYFDRIADEIKKTKKISYSEAEEYIRKGVIFNANFCVQPGSTLANLIYKDSDISKNSGEIKVYLNYIYYYDYYRRIINSYISRKKIINLSRDEFDILVDKIDKELLKAKRADIISDTLTSISDFYNNGGISKYSLQPALIEAYLKEKNLDGMIKILHKEISDNKNKIDIRELKKILLTEPAEKKEEIKIPDAEKRGEPVPVSDNESASVTDSEFHKEKQIGEEIEKGKTEEMKTSIVEDSVRKKVEDEIKYERANEKTSEEKIKEGEAAFKSEEVKKNIQPETEVKNDKEEIIFDDEINESISNKDEVDMEELLEEDIPSKRGLKREKDLFSFLGKKDIERIVNTIFNDDEDDFANTLEKISESGSYEKAAEILQSVFYTYRVNPYKREAVILTNAVSNYFDHG